MMQCVESFSIHNAKVGHPVLKYHVYDLIFIGINGQEYRRVLQIVLSIKFSDSYTVFVETSSQFYSIILIQIITEIAVYIHSNYYYIFVRATVE